MTVQELIALLQQMPANAVVVREGDEHADDERYVIKAEYRPQLRFGMLCANSVILR